MGDIKNILILILGIGLIIVVYMLMISFPAEAETVCRATIETQVISAVAQCQQATQQTMEQLMQIPACAAALAQ